MASNSKESLRKMKIEADRLWECVMKDVQAGRIGAAEKKLITDAMERCNFVDNLILKEGYRDLL